MKEGQRVDAEDVSMSAWKARSMVSTRPLSTHQSSKLAGDGRGSNGRWWVLWGALSNVEYDLVVTDMVNGKTRTYHNASGSYCGGADTRAF